MDDIKKFRQYFNRDFWRAFQEFFINISILFCLSILPFNVLAVGEMSIEPYRNQIDNLNSRVDTSRMNRVNEYWKGAETVSDQIIGLVNLQLQLITVILTIVAIVIPIAAFMLRRDINMIKEKAVISVRNMEAEAKKIQVSEKVIRNRKIKFDKLYNELEAKTTAIDAKIRDLKTKGGEGEKNRLEEIERELINLKSSITRSVQSNTSLSPSANLGFTATYVSDPTSTTTTTVDPFYPSPSPSSEEE